MAFFDMICLYTCTPSPTLMSWLITWLLRAYSEVHFLGSVTRNWNRWTTVQFLTWLLGSLYIWNLSRLHAVYWKTACQPVTGKIIIYSATGIYNIIIILPTDEARIRKLPKVPPSYILEQFSSGYQRWNDDIISINTFKIIWKQYM